MSLEEEIGEILRRRRWSLGIAESASGGLISHRITNVPGSSLYFLGGIVSYDNKVKKELLGVKAKTLASFGAVSQETAQEMAEGACRALGTDIGLADTGIAGPTGGTPQKPVGTVFVGVSSWQETEVRSFHFQGNREENKASFADAALMLLREHLARLEKLASEDNPVVTCFLEWEGKILLLKRSKEVGSYHGRWAGISGYIEAGNTPYAQALQEVREETGLEEKDLTLVKEGEPLPVEDAELLRRWIVRWIVHPYRFRVGTEVARKLTLNWESGEMRWVLPSTLARLRTVPQLAVVWKRVE